MTLIHLKTSIHRYQYIHISNRNDSILAALNLDTNSIHLVTLSHHTPHCTPLGAQIAPNPIDPNLAIAAQKNSRFSTFFPKENHLKDIFRILGSNILH